MLSSPGFESYMVHDNKRYHYEKQFVL